MTSASPSAAWRIWVWKVRDPGDGMSVDTQVTYLEYMITVSEEAGRFTPRVTREGALIEHDGHTSEAWKAASCASLDRAVHIAKTAIDTDRIR
jgi:hypothetical protein